MNSKITVFLQENLPMPLIHLASPEDWTAWYLSQLEWCKGDPAISVFSAGIGSHGIPTLLEALRRYLSNHPEIKSARILCGDDAIFRACREALQTDCAGLS